MKVDGRGTPGVGSPSIMEALNEIEHASTLINIEACRIRRPRPWRKHVILEVTFMRESQFGRDSEQLNGDTGGQWGGSC